MLGPKRRASVIAGRRTGKLRMRCARALEMTTRIPSRIAGLPSVNSVGARGGPPGGMGDPWSFIAPLQVGIAQTGRFNNRSSMHPSPPPNGIAAEASLLCQRSPRSQHHAADVGRFSPPRSTRGGVFHRPHLYIHIVVTVLEHRAFKNCPLASSLTRNPACSRLSLLPASKAFAILVRTILAYSLTMPSISEIPL